MYRINVYDNELGFVLTPSMKWGVNCEELLFYLMRDAVLALNAAKSSLADYVGWSKYINDLEIMPV